MVYRIMIWVVLLWSGASAAQAEFDHNHAIWDTLLEKHVKWINNGVASQVSYAGFQSDHKLLKAYLDTLSQVNQASYDRWSRGQQLAFLINAYNAFTIELILTQYPNLKSIKDLGSLLRSPWKKKFFALLGKKRHLDNIEHDLIRGQFQEPLIHVAVVCASIGCPALRNEAFITNTLNAQLQDSLKRFLSDRSRNRYNPDSGKLEVSKVFDWYREDFEQNHRGYRKLSDVFAPYATLLANGAQAQALIRQGQVPIVYLEYDWVLNDVKS